MSIETLITCPKCSGACFAPSITATRNVFDEIKMENVATHYMHLTCQRCHTQMQFVVDLTPSFDRQESACSVTT